MQVRSANGPGARVRAGPDRRNSYRFSLSALGPSLLLRDGTRVPILNVGASGAQVRCDVAIDARLLSRCRVQLAEGLEFAGSARPVRRLLADDGTIRLGIHFTRLTEGARSKLSGYLVEAQRAQQTAYGRFFHPQDGIVETDPARFVKLVRLYALVRCETLRIYDGETPLDRRLAVRAVAPTGVEGVEVGRGPGLLRDGHRYGFVACGEGSVMAFETEVECDDVGGVRLHPPREFVQSGFRSSPRGVAEASARPRATLMHENLRREPRALDEVSARGFSVRVDIHREPIWPGAVLDAVRLEVDGHVLEASGVVRSVVPGANGRDTRCGVELTAFASAAEERRYRGAVFRWLHPSLRAGSHATPDNAWDVLESSAYVSEWTDGEEQKRVRTAYVKAWGTERGSAGRLLLLEGPGGVAATAAGTWLYPRTWMFHHFGVDQRLRLGQRSFLSYSRELYTGALYEYGHMAGLDYFTLYVERGKRWNDLMYGEFCARHTRRDKLLYRPNEVYRCDTRRAPSFEADARVREADSADLDLLARQLARGCTDLELDGMAWRREDFESGAIRGQFSRIGFERDRRVFVYDSGHGPAWAVVCESGDEGVNVFGLLNTCWLYPLRPVAPAGARVALLHRAVQHYRERCKNHVVLFEPKDSEALDARRLGFRHVSGGMHWLAHRDVMPAWLTHVRDALSVGSVRGRERRVA